MKRSAAAAVLWLVAALLVPLISTASGGRDYVSDFDASADNSQVKFALHFAAHGTAGCGGKATPLPVLATRENLVRQWNTLGDVDVFFVIFAYDSLFSYEYGLTWPADWGSCSTTVCAGDLVIGDILQPGSGLASGFNMCQEAQRHGGARPNYWPVVMHWFVPSSAGEIQILKNPASDLLGITGCWPPENPVSSPPESVFFGGVQMDPYEGPPPGQYCYLSAGSLSFGAVTIGDSAEQVFTIYYSGGGVLSGDVTEDCTDYSIASGGGAFDLSNGQSHAVTVRFTPTSTGTKSCTVHTGSACDSVFCSGIGDLAPVCHVEPESLNFGTVIVGSSTERALTITNIGGGALADTVKEACSDYSIVTGGGTYNLTAGQSRPVTVRFTPVSGGTKTCSVRTGTECASVACTGNGEPPPICQVSPTGLDFGAVAVGNSSDLTFSVSNIGGSMLAGTVTEACDDYSILGDSTYSLTAGQSREFTLRFAPTVTGTRTCGVQTGISCSSVACTGEGMHFSPVAPTGDAQPIVIQAAVIDDLALSYDDEIGVFDGSMCVGAAKYRWSWPITVTAWMKVQLPGGGELPGATAGHAMTFKTWQTDYSRECPATPTYVTGNGVFGESLTAVNPLRGVCPCQTLPVFHGRMDMISLDFDPYDRAVSAVLSDLGTLQVAKDDAGRFYIPQYGVNTIGNIEVCRGYQVYINGESDDEVVINGVPLDSTECCYAWGNSQMYMIGYPYQAPHRVVELFEDIASQVVVLQDDEGRYWIPGYGVNTIGDMLPGQGYQIFVGEPVPSFCYPVLPSEAAGVPSLLVGASGQGSHFAFVATGMSEAVVVTGSDVPLAVGDEVGVFDGSQCVGATTFRGVCPFVVAAWEGDAQYGLQGFAAGNPISLKLWSKVNDEDVELDPDFATPADGVFGGSAISVVRLSAATGTEPQAEAKSLRVSSHPNPSDSRTEITYEIPVATHVTLTVYDAQGRVVRRLVDSWSEPGIHSAIWDGLDRRGRDAATGMYFCRLAAGSAAVMGTIVITR
jgi:hypothetical protein